MKKQFLSILRSIGVFAAVILALWLFLILSACIPNSAIYDNMNESAALLSVEKSEKALEYDRQKWNTYIDYYADAVLAQIAWNMGDSENPAAAALDTQYYDGRDIYFHIKSLNMPPEILTTMGIDPECMNTPESYALSQAIMGKTENNVDYSRYWHGCAGFIRIFHLFTDINGVKAIGFATVLILAAAIILTLLKKKQYALAVVFALSLVAVKIWLLLYCIEYQPPFIIGFLMCILFMLFEKKGNNALFTLSIISGAAVSFFDFLTTETLTILLPLIFVVFIRAKEERLGSFGSNIKTFFGCGIRWLLAYGGAFLAKWGLASLLTGTNKFALAFSSAGLRFSGDNPDLPAAITENKVFGALFSNLSMLFNATNVRMDFELCFWCLLVIAVVLVIFCYLFRKENGNGNAIVLLLLLGSIVFVRYAVLNNHSALHMFFTYRALVSTIMAIAGAVILCVSKPKLFEGKKKNAGRS